MNRRKEDKPKLNVKELRPFKPYKTIYSDFMYFKRIDNDIFTSLDNKRYKKSHISFFPNDKVFVEVL